MNLPLATPPRSLPAARFRRISQVVRALIAVGIGLLIVHLAAFWLSPDYAALVIRESVDIQLAAPLTLRTRTWCLLWQVLSEGVLLVAMLHLWNLFGEYLHARVFSLRALASLRGFARWMLATALLSPLDRVVLSVLVTWQNGPGHRQVVLNLSSDDYMLLLFGTVLLAISSVMAQAARIAEENEGFV